MATGAAIQTDTLISFNKSGRSVGSCRRVARKDSFLKSLGPLNGPKMKKGEKHE